MKSRAHMLLEKEYMKLQKEPIWGIFAQPLNDDDFFVWEAKVYGLKDTLWEGGIFKLYLKFSESFNCSPPEVFFTTIPYHPNVHMSTGKPCVDFLDDVHEWKECYNVGYILLSLQILLAHPVLENAINKEAALLYRENIEVYRGTVMSCVLVSKRLDAELLPNSIEEDTIPPHVEFTEEKGEKPNKNKPQSSKVSFEEYLTLWKGIATSNPSASPLNPLSEFLKIDHKLQKAHFELSRAEVEQEIRIQLSEHRKLMYGKFDGNEERYHGTVGSHRSLPDKVMMLRHVYAAKPNTAEASSIESPVPKDDLVDLDKEAIDLVNWTRNLSPEEMYY